VADDEPELTGAPEMPTPPALVGFHFGDPLGNPSTLEFGDGAHDRENQPRDAIAGDIPAQVEEEERKSFAS
jgi:hypothetical protein